MMKVRVGNIKTYTLHVFVNVRFYSANYNEIEVLNTFDFY